MAQRTRHSSGTALKGYIGTSREMLPSDLPTMRSAFRRAILLQEQSLTPNKPVKDFLNAVAAEVFAIYQTANHMFQHPVIISQKALKDRLVQNWTKAQSVARGLAPQQLVEEMDEKLDRLLDCLR